MARPSDHPNRARRRVALVAVLVGLLLTACYPTITVEAGARGSSDSGSSVTVRATIRGSLQVVIVPSERPSGGVWVERSGGKSFRIPPGHYPPPGQCRVWFPDRPPGRQPPPGDCGVLDRQVPSGAYLVYG